MATSAKIGSTTTLTWHADSPLELTRIGSVNLTATKVDSTTLSSANYYKEFIPGLIDPGDVDIEGLFRPDDAGTILLKTDFEARTSQAFTIAFPTALSTTTWTGTAYITAFSAGDATPEGLIPFSATMSIVGKPSLGVTASTGPTDILIDGNVGNALAEIPTYAAGTYIYSVDTSGDATFNVTVTAPDADTIIMNINGGSDIALTTAVASGEQTATSGEIATVVITVTETGMSPKIYTIRCVDGTS